MLEKIFEEMEKGKSTVKILGREVDFVPLEWAKNILRRRMNDDTTIGINIDDERFWKILFDEACVEGKQAERIYANLRKIRNDGWIPVEERPPKRDGFYLVSLNVPTDLDEMKVSKAWFNEKTMAFSEYGKAVIAWQPLPESYRPEKGGTDGDNNL